MRGVRKRSERSRFSAPSLRKLLRQPILAVPQRHQYPLESTTAGAVHFCWVVQLSDQVEERKVPFLLKAFFAVWITAVVVLPLGFFAFVTFPFSAPSQIFVLNASGQDLKELRIVLRSQANSVLGEESWRSLSSRDTVSLTVPPKELESTLHFRLADEPHIFTTRYLDFWPGDRWRYVIEPGGAVREGYAP